MLIKHVETEQNIHGYKQLHSVTLVLITLHGSLIFAQYYILFDCAASPTFIPFTERISEHKNLTQNML